MARPNKDHPGIPRSELSLGITQCLFVATQRLNEADYLLEKDFFAASGILFSFAIEELGKAVLLREAYGRGADPAPVKGFYYHIAKLKAAETCCPPRYRRVVGNWFGAGAYAATFYGGGRGVSVKDRLAGLFVDWTDGQWNHGVTVDPRVLADSIKGVRLAIEQARAWQLT
jgi:AbiV family abortive infection protein